MAELTDADKKAFIDKINGTIKDADTKARLIAKDWDPTQRSINLDTGEKSVTDDEGVISGLEALLTDTIAKRRAHLEANYQLASSTISSMEGALGKNDPLIVDLHQFRGGLSHASSAKTTTPGSK